MGTASSDGPRVRARFATYLRRNDLRFTASDAPPWFAQEELKLLLTTSPIPAPFQPRGSTSKPPRSENCRPAPSTTVDTGRTETWWET